MSGHFLDDDARRRSADLFVALASRQTTFADVIKDKFAEWRQLFVGMKSLKKDDGSALSGVAQRSGAPCEFDTWGRERSPMFSDEFERFLADEACVEACAEDLGAFEALRAALAGAASGREKTPVKTPGSVAGGGIGGGDVASEVERSFRRMKTPSASAAERDAEPESFVVEKPRAASVRGTLGGATRVETVAAPTREPMRANVTPPPTRTAGMTVKKSPPPTPMPAQLSPPQSEYANTTPTIGDEAHVEHLMSYLTGFHGLLFGLKEHVKRIREATVENVAHELARTDARLDTAIARLEAAMGVESGR